MVTVPCVQGIVSFLFNPFLLFLRERLELMVVMVTLETPDQVGNRETLEPLDPQDLMVTRVLPVTRDLLELSESLATREHVVPLE